MRRRRRSWSVSRSLALATGVIVVLVLAVGLAFAGSRRELAEGTQVAGIDVGGLTRGQAVDMLEARFAEIVAEPASFTAGSEAFSFAPNQLAVQPDWSGAVAAAARSSGGFAPIRGLRRLHTRVFGAEVSPRMAVSNGALDFALDRIAEQVDRVPESAALVRHGLRVVTSSERSGAHLDRDMAAEVIVRTLGSLERSDGSIALPVVTTNPPVTAAMLAPAARRAGIALSAPVVLRGPGRSWRLPRWRIAQLLALPSGGATKLAVAGPLADDYFAALARRASRPAVDARFAVFGERVEVVPSRPGVAVDIPRTARALLRAAISPANRVAKLALARAEPERTTAAALAMGIDSRLSAYKTYNAGTWDRITNLRLGVTLLDDTLVPPGGTFSLNGAIGERTVERGFRSAPVIIGTEYEEEVGGGTSQVATTVFNAAWEAGLRITERNPHSLYISRYQLGRDATVYWPSLDSKFVNDTKHWVLVKGFVEADGISVAIYGGEDRRVESSPGTRTMTGAVPVKRVKDPTLAKGKTVVESEGSQPSRTVVTRTIYGGDGTLLRTETWTTSYRGETRVVRLGTKRPAKPPKAASEKPKPGEKATTPTDGATPAPTRP